MDAIRTDVVFIGLKFSKRLEDDEVSARMMLMEVFDKEGWGDFEFWYRGPMGYFLVAGSDLKKTLAGKDRNYLISQIEATFQSAVCFFYLPPSRRLVPS